MTGKRKAIPLLLLLSFAFIPLLSQAKPKSDRENFRLIHSDKLFLSKFNNENIIELFGGVHFFYGDTEFRCNNAFIYEKQKITRLKGNVKVSNDTLDVFADSIAYYRIPNLLTLVGNVIITEQKDDGVFNQFASETGTYDKAKEIVTARGNVRAFSRKDKARAQSNYVFWDRKNGYGYMIEKPELWSEGKDTLYVRSEKMEFFDADRKVIATFDVLAQSKDYKATSDFLLYFLKEDKAIFQGEPKFTSGFADATAKEFYLFFDERKLTRAELKDSCLVYFAEAKDKPKHNWVKADFVSMNILDENLQDFTAEDRVTYYYLQEKEEKKDYFSNNAEGTYLMATFREEGKLDQIQMKTRIKGVYRFENSP